MLRWMYSDPHEEGSLFFSELPGVVEI